MKRRNFLYSVACGLSGLGISSVIPLNVAPFNAILLNNGRKVDFTLKFSPTDHGSQKAYLNLINLLTNELCNTVLVIKLEFDRSLDELAKHSSPMDGDSGWVNI